MDTEAVLDALQAETVKGTLAGGSLRLLAEAAGRSPEAAVATLLDRAGRDRRWLAARAARCLDAPAPETASRLETLAVSETEAPRARDEALRSLTILDPAAGVRAAVALLTAPGMSIDARASAVDIADELPAAALLPQLVAALRDGPTMVREAAADALGRIGGSAALEAIEATAESDPESGVRSRAAKLLARLRAREPGS